MAGVPIAGTQALAGVRADLYRFGFDFAEEEGAFRVIAAEWGRALLRWQLPCGALPAPGSRLPYVFDTGQVVRGWVSLLPGMPSSSKSRQKT